MLEVCEIHKFYTLSIFIIFTSTAKFFLSLWYRITKTTYSMSPHWSWRRWNCRLKH